MTQREPGPERPDYDQALKRLLLRAHDGFLALVAPGVRWRGERSPELPAIARQGDLIWEVELPDGQTGLLHIELQTAVKGDIGERLAEYAIRLWRRDHLPVNSLVIFLRAAETVPMPPFEWEWMGRSRQRYDFDVLRLWEVPPEQVLGTPYYELWPLAGLMAGVTVDTTLAVAARISTTPLQQQEKNDLTRTLALFAGMRLPRQVLAEALRRAQMTLNLWEESSLKDALLDLAKDEVRDEVTAQVRDEVTAQVRDEAKSEGLRESLRLVLAARFGTLDTALLDAISRAHEDTLKRALTHAATNTLEQIRRELGLG